MKYISEYHVRQFPLDWSKVVDAIRSACFALSREDYAQPIKPYLRFRDLTNRIIAMPAFIGGDINGAGIKWISSFPGNIQRGQQRANSVVILNNVETGEPYCIINSGMVSGIRTAAVSGLMLEEWLKANPEGPVVVGMTGFGPIGKLHYEMAKAILGSRLKEFRVYDLRTEVTEDIPEIRTCNSWQEAFEGVDVFMTCTVSKEPYIDIQPKKGSLQLNVSLRDYRAEFRRFADQVVVDSWAEVCRESTDIEKMFEAGLLQENEAILMDRFVSENHWQSLQPDDVLMFNPMGMAVFDIAVGVYLFQQFEASGEGVDLSDAGKPALSHHLNE